MTPNTPKPEQGLSEILTEHFYYKITESGEKVVHLNRKEAQAAIEALYDAKFQMALGDTELAIENRPGASADNMARNGLRTDARTRWYEVQAGKVK